MIPFNTRSEMRLRHILFLDTAPYLREWAEHTYGNPVQFPLRSREHAILRYYLSPPPEAVVPDTRRALLRLLEQGKAPLQIIIPVIRWKPYARYNYLPRRGRHQLRGCLQALFDINLWNDMEPYLYGLPKVVAQVVGEWCTAHGISVAHEETVLKHYRTMQRFYAEHGIPVRRKVRPWQERA